MKQGIDYVGVGVGAIIINEQGQLLLLKRGPLAKNERGKWEIPGGGVEFGETLQSALEREMREEIGVEITVHRLFHIYDHILPEENQHWVSPTYLCTIKSGIPQIKEPGKTDDLGWYSFIDASQLPLSMVTQHDIESLLRDFPDGLTLADLTN